MAQTLAVSSASSSSTATRQCLVTKVEAAKEALWRFVLDPDGRVTFDITQRLPGRGVWLTPSRAVLEEAIRKKLFAKGFKAAAITPPDLCERMQRQCQQRLLDSLSLARKAGQAVAGTQKVSDFTRKHAGALILLASDASPNTLADWRGQRLLHLQDLTAAELGSIFGRDIAVVIAVAPGRLCDTLERAHQFGQALQPQPIEMD